MLCTFLFHGIIFLTFFVYRMERLNLNWERMQQSLRLHISVLTYSSLFSILFSAIMITYFVYRRWFQWVNGIFIATVVVALLFWMLKLYIVNYY